MGPLGNLDAEQRRDLRQGGSETQGGGPQIVSDDGRRHLRCHQRSYRREGSRLQHGDPPVGRILRLQGGSRGLSEPAGEVGREHDTGLGWLRGEPKCPDHPADADRRVDVTEPEREFLVLLTRQRRLEVVGDRPGRLVASHDRVLAGSDDTAQVPQVQVFHLALCCLGAIEPLGNAQLGQHVLGHLDDRLLGHRRLTCCLELGVLLLDTAAHRTHALERQLGDRTLLLGEIGQHGIPSGLARAKSLRLGTLREFGGRLEVRTRASGIRAVAISRCATTAVAGTVTTTVSTTVSSAVTLRITLAVALAVAPTPIVSPLAALAPGAGLDHGFEGLLAREEFEHDCCSSSSPSAS